MDDDARLTIVDVVNVTMAIAFFGALGIVFYEALNEQAAQLSQGELLLLQAIPPLFLLVLFSIVWVKATSGGVR